MAYWWVNQNQTHRHEIEGGYMWSPKTRADGARNQFYDFMLEVVPGDVVFSYFNTAVGAVGVATGTASTAPIPAEFRGLQTSWTDEGWYVPVEFTRLAQPVRTKDHIDKLRRHLPEKYSPITRNGDGLQSVYLARVPEAMAEVLISLIGEQIKPILRSGVPSSVDEAAADRHEEQIKADASIGATEKEQLVKSRRGQGIFKSRLELIEKGCRLTGVEDSRHLRASHIKPWKDSTPFEKLDGNNGLLLAPHVDHLFDRGFISFEDDGTVIVSPYLDDGVLTAWAIKPDGKVGGFSLKQANYLAYHRAHVLLRE